MNQVFTFSLQTVFIFINPHVSKMALVLQSVVNLLSYKIVFLDLSEETRSDVLNVYRTFAELHRRL